MDATSLPMQSAPHDTLRYGLSSLKDEAAAAHPVQVLEQRVRPQLCTAVLASLVGMRIVLKAWLVCAVSTAAMGQQGEDAQLCVWKRFLRADADRAADSWKVRSLRKLAMSCTKMLKELESAVCLCCLLAGCSAHQACSRPGWGWSH